MNHKNTLYYLFLIFTSLSFSQVGIGTTAPTATLDIVATNTIGTNTNVDGILIPRVDRQRAFSMVSTPIATLIYVNNIATGSATGSAINITSDGFYFFDGTVWQKVTTGANRNWELIGNSGTTAGTNFIGTTDAQPLILRTNNANRLTVSSTGDVSIGANAVTGNNVFEVFSSVNNEDAINGYATGTGYGVYGNTSGTGIALFGLGNNTDALAIYGRNNNAGGTGIVGAGGNTSGNFYPTSGVSGNGVITGVAGISADVTSGVGVRGNGNGTSVNITSGVGAGVAGSGNQIGVFGYASNTTGNKNGGVFTSEHGSVGLTDNPYAYLAGSDGSVVYGGYFDANQDNTNNSNSSNQGEDYAYVGVVSGNTTYKILGTGSVSTIVKDINNERRILFAPEAPEILFQDYGVGQLKNGIAVINMDQILSKNIFVNENHPLKVFIQLEGDCNGVYVTNKSADSFTVKELKNGTSNTSFSWQIVANRADTTDGSGNILSKHVDVRFPVGPGPLKHKEELKSKANEDLHKEKKEE
jgi:hypothetical protein